MSNLGFNPGDGTIPLKLSEVGDVIFSMKLLQNYHQQYPQYYQYHSNQHYY